MSGLFLLDKSIKLKDVIAGGGAYGWVESLGTLYVSVRIHEGIEYFIPNEDLIMQRQGCSAQRAGGNFL